MNAIERKEKRKLRLIVIRQIEVIEANNCLVCPNRKSTDTECCKTCPIPDQLNALGKQLIAVTHREEQRVAVDPEKKKKSLSRVYELRREREKRGIPPKKIPKVKPPFVNKRKKGDPSIVFTADEYIQAIADGEYKSEIARRIGMPDSTLYHRTVKWDLTGLTRDKAKEMLQAKGEGLA
ncbi:hypothetical protein [Paenibacillus oryzisoli]|uniref:Uncharacterized protein n=1 Tax=Paenibacillus oryzisoli TaxID=1850517 RepID=A0A198AE91_9BACL|nr:hypothetical protein [Paenibacillus oryzisoli]OAS19263.1 hypothetical protein A8708_26500 [Paenibacillus oryzisoli]